MKKGEGFTCIKDYDKNHKCVETWISTKRTEWKKIKDHYLEKKHEKGDRDMKSLVRNFLEEFEDRPEFKKAIKPCKGLTKFESFCGLNGDESSEKKGGKNSDIIDCMIKKLEEKATSCQEQHSGSEQCTTPPSNLEDDEEDLLLDEEENTVEAPKFCPEPEKEDVKEEDECKATGTPSKDEKTKGEEGAPAPPEPPAAEPERTEEAKPPESVEPAPGPPPSPPPPLPPLKTALVTSTLAWSVGIGFAAFTYFFLKQVHKQLFQSLQMLLHKLLRILLNKYIPYTSGKYRGKRYIYLEGDSGTDSGYTDHYSDITSSSESEYEELDINDIYVPRAPKYKTLIEVVLEPSGNNTTASGNNTPTSGKNTPSDTQNDIQNDGIPSSKITDNEWNTLKHDFISQYLQSEQPNGVPNDYKSEDIPFNTQPNTLYFDKPQEKPFITSIHDRNLLSGEEISYNVNMSTNSMDDIPINSHNNVYSGIDLINDSLNNNNVDIYDELLKRKENELFGTEHHPKRTTTNHFATPTRDDPIHNQLELFHKWLDRHRDMCEKLKNDNERLAKLKEEWENETHSGNTHPSDSNKTLNTDVSIQIHMDNPKTKNEITNMDTNPDKSTMDTILDDLEKYNEPYYYDFYEDDIYYDVNDDDKASVDHNKMDNNNSDVPTNVQIEMNVINNQELLQNEYPISHM
ncbi:hypothetical protein PFNF135_04232 [Plasmodium falciparum NF135/5.C10]|uniref:Plasmodium falciparum erythrocyte membrane protein 1 acidic terminal segment domain-containing protein n=1 Tax=Plasmodium falciparum NF135/5.C10 TaxID=1036726 RepID=W4IEC7_PLAFA|nr:hypothetical protein PFNF135_04232 [Plasmodium falciparum NF135/5.C10]